MPTTRLIFSVLLADNCFTACSCCSFRLLALFVLLRNGRAVASRFLETCDRLFGEAGEGLVEKMVDATRGTVNGTVLVAVGEGLLIGVGYFIAGVPNAVLFTIFTTAFAMLPFGAWLAFTAAAVVLISGGGSGLRRQACFVGARSSCLLAIISCGRPWSVARRGSVSLRLCRDLRRSCCLWSGWIVSGSGHHGRLADSLARVDIPARGVRVAADAPAPNS